MASPVPTHLVLIVKLQNNSSFCQKKILKLKIMAKYAVNCDLRNVDTNFKDDNTNRLI